MNRVELLDTTAFRLAMLFSALFGLLAVGVFALIYWLNTSFVEAQTAQRLSSETDALMQRYRGDGIAGLADAVQARSAVAGLVNLHYLLVDEAGAYVAGNLLRWPETLEDASNSARFRRLVQLRSSGAMDWDRDEYYEVAARALRFPTGHRLLIGIGLYEATELREQSLAGLIIGSAGTVLLALLVGVLLGRTMLSRVRAIDSALGDIMEGDLARRINPGGRHDEFAALAARINGVLDRVEQLVGSLRAMTNNVSHDLRTPLHRLRSRLEQMLLGGDSGGREDQIESGIQDIDEILVTFNDLLAIAEAEAGAQSSGFETVDVSNLTSTVAELYAAAAEEHDLHFRSCIEPGIRTEGKGSLLSQALSNLLENAIKFTPSGGSVAVQLTAGGGGFDLVVADTGPGVPAADRERVLQAFERLDSARSSPGSGLGLSVVTAIARLHGAQLRLEDNDPGLRVRLHFGRQLPAPLK